MKQAMLTMVLAVSAVMAFAAAREARIDVYNLGAGKSVKVADKGTASRTETPKWMQQKTRGGALAVFALKGADWQTGTVTFTAVGDGKLEICLMGPDVRDKDKKFMKVYVDFSKLVVNGKTLYEGKDGEFKTVWHNEKFSLRIPVKDGETVKIEATFRPSAK